MLTPRGYGVVCMLVAHNTCTMRHQHLGVLTLYMYSVIYMYLQDRAHYQAFKRGDLVRAQELLALGANVDHDQLVSYIHVEHTWVCWVSIH